MARHSAVFLFYVRKFDLLKLNWGHFGITSGSTWAYEGDFGVALGLLWDNFWHMKVTLGALRGHFGVTLGSL